MAKRSVPLICLAALFGIGLIALTSFLNGLSNRHYPEHRLNRLLAQAIDKHHRQARHVLIGHSQATALKFRHAPVDGFEYWFNSQDMFETAHLFGSIRDIFPEVETVYIPLTTRDLFMDNGSAGSNASLTRVTHYANQRILRDIGVPDWQLVAWDWQNAFQGWFMPAVRRDRWYRPVERLRQKAGLINREPRELTDANLDPLGYRKPVTATNATETFGKKVRRQSRYTVNQLRNARYFDYRGSGRVKAAMDRMIAEARRQNICIVFFATPKTTEYETIVRAAIGDSIDSFDTYLDDLTKRASGYKVVDLREMQGLDTFTHFYDSFHLNEAGARLFTSELFRKTGANPCKT